MTNLPTYFPRVRPLNYDALGMQLGCQSIDPMGFRGFTGIEQYCSEEANLASSQFSKSPNLAYCLGPAAQGSEMPFLIQWVVWTSKGIVRFASNIPLDGIGDNVGTKYPFLGYAPTALACAFTRQGYLAVAAQQSSLDIEIARPTSLTAANNFVFNGLSPALWQVGLTHSSEDATESELVCFYLPTSGNGSLMARFESEDFAVQHPIVPNSPGILTQLIGASLENQQLILRAIDSYGLYVTMYGAADAIRAFDAETLSLAFSAGKHLDVAVPTPDQFDKSLLSIAFSSGKHLEVAVFPEDIPAEPTMYSIAFIGGAHA